MVERSDDLIQPEDAPEPPNEGQPVWTGDEEKHDPRGRILARGDAVELAGMMLEDLREKSSAPVVFDEQTWWRYDDETGVWKDVSNDAARNTVANYAGMSVQKGKNLVPLSLSSNAIDGTVSVAKSRVADGGKRFFADTRSGITFTNGFVTIENASLVILPHSPEQRSRHAMPFAFDPHATCPRWDRYLLEVLAQPLPENAGADAVDAEDQDLDRRVQFVHEWIGAALLGFVVKYAMCLVLFGEEGNNGKSVFLSVLRSLFPASSVIAMPPQQWTNNFHLAELANRKANIVSEMPSSEFAGTETFKSVVSGDTQMAAHKHGKPFKFECTAGHAFACNKLPGTSDQSGGFWRRWGVIRFDRKFTDKDRDIDLSEKLAAELPGILVRVLRGAEALVRRGSRGFVIPQASIDAKEEWRTESDQVEQFFAECLYFDEAGYVKSDEIYPVYSAYAKASNNKPLAKNNFLGRLRKLKCGGASIYRRQNDDRWYLVGFNQQARARYAH